MSQPARKRLSYEEYLALERETDRRHEFLRGEAWAMAGGTIRHSAIKTNLTALFETALGGRSCRTYDADLKVRVLETGLATYPDLTVICGKPETHPDDSNAATNPTVLLEVLSDETEAWDRGGKFAHYRRIDSLRHYVLVDQDEERIEVYTRQEDGSWNLVEHGPEDSITLDAVDLEISVADAYANLPEES